MIDSELPTGSPGPGAGPNQGGFSPGDVVGRYNLLGHLGSGGFGVVFEAEQTEPVRRRVALKVIKPGMDSEGVVSRFEAERQALAVMDHPNIAHVLDGGVTAPHQGSRPFFVMELVRGIPITEFCDKHRLTVEERCRLLIRVCSAVQHAHAKGVVHRDLKPSNILVTYNPDGDPQPKVIDFGVAKALNQRLTEATIFTEQGQLLGTPEYMSPEQAEMSGLDIDTRSDVYSLGVVLYELLTGALPFDGRTLRAAGFAEIQRIIREQDPVRPSQRLSAALSDPESGSRIISSRNTEARQLSIELRRDLDWVVMKCLEKPRDRRYDTCSALAADLHRFLDHEPLQAGPPDLSYRLSKIVRKHRASVFAATACALLLLLGITGTTYGLLQAQQAAEDAESEAELARLAEIEQRRLADAEAEARAAADAAAQEARLSLRSAKSVNSMFGELLIQATPMSGNESDTAIFRRLVGSASNYLKDEALVFEVASELRLTIIGVLLRMGRTEEAEEHHATLRADLQARNLSPRMRLWYEAQIAGHRTYSGNSVAYTEEFERLVEEVAAGLPRSDAVRAQAFLNLARLRLGSKAYEASLAAAEEALAATDEVKQDHQWIHFLAQMTAAAAKGYLGDVDTAIERLEELYTWHQENLGPLDSEAGAALGALRDLYVIQGNVQGLESTFDRHLKNVEMVFGFYSDYAIGTLTYYANGFETLGLDDRTDELLTEAVSRASARFGPKHPDTINLLNAKARRALDAGEPQMAIRWLGVLESDGEWTLAAGPAELSRAIGTFAGAARKVGQVERGTALLFRARSQLSGVDQAERASAAVTLGWAMHELMAYEEAMDICESVFADASDSDQAYLLRCMARSAAKAGLDDAAAALHDRAVLAADAADIRIWDHWAALSDAGWFYHHVRNDQDRAEDLLRRARAVYDGVGAQYERELGYASTSLARLLRFQGKLDAAAIELDKVLQSSEDALVLGRASLERAQLVAAVQGEAESLEAFQSARTQLASFPEERLGFIDALWGEAHALQALGRNRDALDTGLQAMQLREQERDEPDGYQLFMMQRLAEWGESLDPAISESLLTRKLSLCRDHFGSDSQEHHEAWLRLAQFYEHEGRLNEALDNAVGLVESLRDTHPATPRMAEAALVAGRSAFHLTRWEEAESLLRTADQVLERLGEAHWHRRGESLHYLISLFAQRDDLADESDRATQLEVLRAQKQTLEAER